MHNNIAATIIKDYSNKFHNDVIEFNDENTIASPFGSWILLAFVAGATKFEESDATAKNKIESYLGVSIEEAYKLSVSLMDKAPESLKIAISSWVSQAYIDSDVGIAYWANKQSSNELVEYLNYIPTQEYADSWAKSKTLGLIEKFPATIESWMELIASSAVALDITWASKFEKVETPTEMKTYNSEHMLYSKDGNSDKKLYRVDGKVYAAHTAQEKYSRTGSISVLSVIGETDLTPAEEIAVALRISQNDNVEIIDPFELELNYDYGFMKISEREIIQKTTAPVTTYAAYLPAWKAENKHELTDFGFKDAGQSIGVDKNVAIEALQSAVASYNLSGFSAAAVTSLMVGRSAVMTPPKEELTKVRDVVIYFNKPYSAITNVLYNQEYAGVPLFTAWVVKATDVES